MRRSGLTRGRLAILLAAIVVAAVGATVAARAQSGSGTTPSADFTWKMAERYGNDANADRLIDHPTSPSFVNPSSWTVELNACGGKEPPIAGHTYEWTVPTAAGPRIETRTEDCKLTHAFPSLGSHSVSLKVTNSAGSATKSQTPVLRDFVIVSMGDSAASGEGNPDWLTPNAGTSFETAGFTHKWNNTQCHRSALAGPAQAALRIEKRDPHSSVTFIHVACSGARITRGVLNTYQGIEPTQVNPAGQDPFDCDDPALGNVTYGTPNDSDCLPSQIDQVKAAVGARPIDALLVSAGINDLHFSKVVLACLTKTDCETEASGFLRLGVNGSGPDKTGREFLTAKLATLPGLYTKLAQEIRAKLALSQAGKVYLTEYPDPSTDDAGNRCDTYEPEGLKLGDPLGRISPGEWKWAKDEIIDKLSGAITAAASSNGTTTHPWVAVGKTTAKFDRHGHCARDTWFHTVARSFLYQRDSEGSFHPNRAGHFNAYALPIEAELAKAQNLDVTAAALPENVPGDIELWESISQGLAPLFDVLSRVDFESELKRVLAYRPEKVSIDLATALKQAGTAIGTGMKSLENLVQNTAVPKALNVLDHRLDDLDNDGDLTRDGSFANGAFTLDVEGTITPHAPALEHELVLDVTLKGQLPAGFKLDRESLAVDTSSPQPVELKGRLRFLLGPHFPPKANRKDAFHLASGSFKLSAKHEAELPKTAPVKATYGILDVGLHGPAGGKGIDVAGAIELKLKDPSGDGKVTWEEWSTSTSVSDIVSVSCDPSSHANLDLTATAALAGVPTGDLATLKLADSNLCDGIATPSLTLLEPKLKGFSRMTPADIVSAYQRLAAALRTMLKRDDVSLPFLKEKLSHAMDLGDRVVDFLKAEGLVDPGDPLSQTPLTAAQLDKVATIEKATQLLAKNLGLTATNPFNLRYDAANERLLLDLKMQQGPPATPLSEELDLGLLGRAGLLSITTSGKAEVKPSYAIDLGVGLDLGPDPSAAAPKSIQDRLLVKTTGAQITASADVRAKLALDAQVGILAVKATADNAGAPRELLTKRDSNKPMLALTLSGGTNGYATASDVFGTDAQKFAVKTEVNASVPKFPVAVTAMLGSTALASGNVEVEWPDVRDISGTNGPQVKGDAAYDRDLLRFDFDRQNPRALLGLILTTTRDGMAQVERLARDNEKLARSLPVLGAGYDDMVGTFAKVREVADQLIALNQSLTLQGLEQKLEAELNRLLGLSNAVDVRLDTSTARTALIIKLAFCQASQQGSGCAATAQPLSAPLLLNVPGNGIIGAEASGQVQLDYLGKGVLELGVELPKLEAGTSTSPAPKLASGEQPPSAFVTGASGVTLDVEGSAQAVASAKLGPFEVSLGLPGDDAVAKAAARFAVDTGGAASKRWTPAAWATEVLNKLGSGFTIRPATGVYCNIANQPGPHDGCAKLPVYLEDAAGTVTANGKKWSKLGEITFTSTDLLAGGSFSGEQQVAQALASKALRFSTLVDGVSWLVGRAKSALDGLPQGAELPLIGGKLSAGSEALAKLQDFLTKVQAVATEVDKIAETAQAGALESKLESELYGKLGPSGLNLILDRNGSGAVDAADVEATVYCGANQCAATALPPSFTDVKVRFAIGQQANNVDVPLDLGFDGLQLSSSENLKADAGWKLDVAIGIDRAGGFYVDADAGQELTASAKVRLPATMTGQLAFLKTEITDNHAGNDLDVEVGADIKGQRLYLKDVLAQGWSVTDRTKLALSAKGCADLDLGLNLKAAGGGLPSLWGRLIAKGDLGGCAGSTKPAHDIRDGLDNAGLTVELRDVEVDAGDLITNFIRPVAKDVQRYTQPLQPVITEIDKPIPVVNELAKLAGKSGMTWYQAWAAGQQVSGNDVTALTTIKSLVSFINGIPANTGSARIRVVDTVKVDVAQAAKPPTTPEEAAKLIASTSTVKDVLAELTSRTGGWDLEVEAGKVAPAGKGAKFNYPALKNPTSLVQLFFGKDVDLVTFDAGPLRASQPFDFSYGLPFAKVGIAGNAGVSGHLEVGYDTAGIRRILRDKLSLSSLGSLVHGLYLADLKDGKDVPEIRLDADMHLYANVGIPGVNAEAQGGVEGNVDVNLHDDRGEGKIRYEDVAKKIMTPQCLFDTSGKISAYARVVLTGGPFKGTKNIVPQYTLLEIPDIQQWCTTQQPAPPEPAELSNGTLTLNMGPQARRDKRNIANGETDEKFTVTELGGGAVGVTFLSAYKEYGDATSPVKKISAQGDSGADAVVVSNKAGGDFTLPVEFDGGAGNDRLYGGSAVDTLSGGGDDDTIVGADGGDDLKGGSGQDTIDGGRGGDAIDGGADIDKIEGDPLSDPVTPAADPATAVDTIHGGDGADEIWGAIGDDKLYGDAGDDVIHGNEGTDTIEGGADHDDLLGDEASDTLKGDAGHDNIVGGPGNVTDTLHGGADRDYLLGDDGTITRISATTDSTLAPSAAHAGADILRGDGGNDVIDGQGGKDDVDGGSENDEVRGGDGEDTLAGGTGADKLHGDGDVDTLRGGDGADWLYGGGADDELHGEDGYDTMFGDGGGDKLYGGATDDSISGGPGEDLIEGGDASSGSDPIQFLGGDSGKDKIVGGSGRDDISGGSEVDTIEAGGDADRADGGEGEDVINGSEGHDALSGGDDDDLIHGDAGDDTLAGQGGRDRLIGGRALAYYADGDDVIAGGAGNDLILGDNGTISAAGVLTPVLGGSGTYDDVVSGGDGEDIVRGQYGNDTLGGDGGEDHLRGEAGDDRVEGGDGNDLLWGNDGRDTLKGGPDADYLLGDDGTVTPATSGPKFWPGGAPNYTVTLVDDGGDADRLSGGPGDDHLFGGMHDDVLEGDEDDDYLEGNHGRDRIFGYDAADGEGGKRPGNDDLIGGGAVAGREDDRDLIGGSGGADVIAGDNAVITRVLDSTGHAWEVDPATHAPERQVTLLDQGAQAPLGEADTVYAGSGSDRVFGQIGDDVLRGNEARDRLEGHDGDDDLHGGDEPDTLDGAAGDDKLFGGGAADELLGADGEDELDGAGGEDTLTGGADDDRLTGGLDPDTVDGGGGSDVAAYRGAPSGVVVSLARGTARGGDGDDRLVDLEHVDGSEFDDILLGDAAGNRLSGFGARDELHGLGGADELRGGDGGDELHGGDAGDVAEGEGEDDSVFGDDGTDTIRGGAGNDRLVGGNDDDDLDGGYDTDVVDYGSAPGPVEVALALGRAWSSGDSDTLARVENVDGSPFDDILAGDGGANALNGFDGADMVEGAGGADALDGGAGVDTATYAGAAGVSASLAGGWANGGDGPDTLTGLEHVDGSPIDDVLTGDNGPNRLAGSSGNDQFDVRDGNGHDSVDCGYGLDWALRDPGDLASDCETFPLGGTLTSGPAAAALPGGSLHVFARGSDGDLWERAWSGASWQSWNRVPGNAQIVGEPAVVARGGGIDVFVRGTDNQLYYTFHDGSQWAGYWQLLGGQLASAPTAASWGPGRLDVFVQWADGTLHQIYNDNDGDPDGWSGWISLGESITARPAAASADYGQVDVFMRGPDNALHQLSWDGSRWTRDYHGGVLTSGPAVASRGWGELDVIVRGTDNALYQLSRSWWWSGWHRLGGDAVGIKSDPGLVGWGWGRLDAFVRVGDDSIQQLMLP